MSNKRPDILLTVDIVKWFCYEYGDVTLPERIIQTSSRTGKTIAASIPARRSLPHRLDTMPARVGPPEHPRSPARASMANKTVPPPFMETAALLKVPGQRMPTEKPHTAHPSRLITGMGTRAMHKYEATQRIVLYFIKRSRFSIWPYLP